MLAITNTKHLIDIIWLIFLSLALILAVWMVHKADQKHLILSCHLLPCGDTVNILPPMNQEAGSQLTLDLGPLSLQNCGKQSLLFISSAVYDIFVITPKTALKGKQSRFGGVWRGGGTVMASFLLFLPG